MSSIIVNDGITPYIGKLLVLSRGFTNQALNKTAADMQKAMKAKARNAGTHKWNQKFDTKARRTLTYGTDKQAYSRFSKKSGGKLHGMENFIKFKMFPETSQVVVGFINTKSYMSYSFNNGVQKNFKRVKGQNVKEIAEMLETGGREDLTKKQRAFFRASGMYGIAKKGFVIKKARPVISPVVATMGSTLKNRFEKAYDEAFKSTKIDFKPIRRRA